MDLVPSASPRTSAYLRSTPFLGQTRSSWREHVWLQAVFFFGCFKMHMYSTVRISSP